MLNKHVRPSSYKMIYIIVIVLIVFLIGSVSAKEKNTNIVIGVSNKEANFNEELINLLKTEYDDLGFYYNKLELLYYQDDKEVLEALDKHEINIGFVSSFDYIDDLKDSFQVIGARDDNMYTNGEEVYFEAYYNAILLAKRNEVTIMLENKEVLAYEDFNKLRFCVQSSNSLTGYLYIDHYLNTNYNFHINDLSYAIKTDSYFEALEKLSTNECDVISGYSNIREDFEEAYSLSADNDTIYDETFILAETNNIYTNAIVVNKEKESIPYINIIKKILCDLNVYSDGTINSFTLIDNDVFNELYDIKNSLKSK